MSKLFNSVQLNKPKRNKFNLSHERKMSMKMANLTPIMCQEVVPGDSFRVNTELLARLQPLITPMLHRVKIKVEYFFVPNRLVWDNWTKFITGGDKGQDSPVHPFIEIGATNYNNFEKGSLADFLGIPAVTQVPTQPHIINALPFRAYQLIYNEYYRDQNLTDPVDILKTDGLDQSSGALVMRKRAWEKDYFTSCLPYPQKSEDILAPATATYKIPSIILDPDGQPSDAPAGSNIDVGAGGQLRVNNGGTPNIVGVDNLEELGITINDLRTAARIQEYFEKLARAGSRYIEVIRSFFGVESSDARLQRPEFLGGSTKPFVISEVLSTFQAGDDTGYPQGNMTGHGISGGNIMGFKRSFEEHGFIFGLLSVIPTTAYQQGLPKSFRRFQKEEYYWPTFAQLGEQAVLNEEIYFDPTQPTVNGQTFGYQSRYAEYKYQPSTVHGDFKDNLDFWHMGRKFTALPQLNTSFIQADPTKRVFAVETQDEDEILMQVYNRVDAIRPMPYFNNPTL